MEKPSTKKPMNILKTMVFLKNFMKKLIMICTNPQTIDDFIEQNRENLKENEYFTIETRIKKYFKECRIYINDDQLGSQ